jgi:YggT family protein
MERILGFFYFITQGALTIVFWLVVANAVISWLVAFNVLNMRNSTARQFVMGLDRVVTPLLAPLRRFIPPLGGMDFTPVIFLLLLTGVQRYLIPLAFDGLARLLIHPVPV